MSEMRKFSSFKINDSSSFLKRLLSWSSSFRQLSILFSNGYSCQSVQHSHCSYDLLAAAGSLGDFRPEGRDWLPSLDKFFANSGDWLFGHLGYDIKNEIENLVSNQPDKIGFPVTYFFIPRYIFLLRNNKLDIGWRTEYSNEDEIIRIAAEIENIEPYSPGKSNPVNITGKTGRSDYLKSFKRIKKHIERGDIYEVNFCNEFFSSNTTIDPAGIWLKLNEESPMPFSCFYRLENRYLLCASPERFMKKTGNTIISQPIKGTSARGDTDKEDLLISVQFASNPKERSENIMITDLVRNDLSRIALRSSVKVDEFCGLHSFPGVFQMQSTVSAKVDPGIRLSEIIRAMFPMGSMTGAPKVKAMEIIEKFEKSRRGLYSGSVGYITPGMDFDFNVVIRSIQYNMDTSNLSYMVGGAITGESGGPEEYEECLLKAKAIRKVLGRRS